MKLNLNGVHFLHLRDEGQAPYGTIAYKVQEGRAVGAYALVSPNDNFSYKAGRTVAAVRLLSPKALKWGFVVSVEDAADPKEQDQIVLDYAKNTLKLERWKKSGSPPSTNDWLRVAIP